MVGCQDRVKVTPIVLHPCQMHNPTHTSHAFLCSFNKALCVQYWQNGCNLKTQTSYKSCQAVSINIPKFINKVDLSFTSMLSYWTRNNTDRQKSDAAMSQKMYEKKLYLMDTRVHAR